MRYRPIRSAMMVILLLAALAPAFPAASREASPGATPEAGGPFNASVVSGDGVHLLEPAPEGEVAIIAMSEVERGELHVIVHNNTGEDVGSVYIDAVIFGEDRSLIAVASNGISSGRLLPGGVGMTTLLFDEDEYPDMVEIETLLEVKEPDEDSLFYSIFPTIDEWARQDENLLIILSNGEDEPIVDPEIRFACFSESGELRGVTWRPADDDLIPVGEQIRMQDRITDDDCSFIVIMSDGERD